jgi:2-polyprenyl-3-methyl-5-hydroxy-6-metoxy-1,4-benzoquinol methylase
VSTELTPDDLDRFAQTYYLNDAIDDVDIEERAQAHSIPMIVASVSGRSRVLEMGFGTGLVARLLLEHGVPLEVVEGSSHLRDVALTRHPDLPVHLSMFEDFTPAEPYDAVLALHVLEHVDDPLSLLARIDAWLNPGGVVVVVTPNARSIHRMLGVAMGVQEKLDDLSERDHLVGHRRVYDLDGLCRELTDGGYSVVNTFGYFVKPLANSQMIGWPSEVLDGLNLISPDFPTEHLANIGVVARRP